MMPRYNNNSREETFSGFGKRESDSPQNVAGRLMGDAADSLLGRNQDITETPALKEVKGASLKKSREMLNTQITNFLLTPEVFRSMIQMIENSPDDLAATIGRDIAPKLLERTVQQADSQGFTMPQSAIWVTPDKDGEGGGAAATVIDRLLDIAIKTNTLTEGSRPAVVQQAFMHLVKTAAEGSEYIREGALAWAEQFGGLKGERKQQQAESASEAMGMLNSLKPSEEEGLL